jgi:hypothetical protein
MVEGVVCNLAFATLNPSPTGWLAVNCVSAWNKDPVFGVIGIQSGPRH